MVQVTAADGIPWSVDAQADGDQVSLVIGFRMAGEPYALQLRLDRPDSRILARAILAAGGDATERTFTGSAGAGRDG